MWCFFPWMDTCFFCWAPRCKIFPCPEHCVQLCGSDSEMVWAINLAPLIILSICACACLTIDRALRTVLAATCMYFLWWLSSHACLFFLLLLTLSVCVWVSHPGTSHIVFSMSFFWANDPLTPGSDKLSPRQCSQTGCCDLFKKKDNFLKHAKD